METKLEPGILVADGSVAFVLVFHLESYRSAVGGDVGLVPEEASACLVVLLGLQVGVAELLAAVVVGRLLAA